MIILQFSEKGLCLSTPWNPQKVELTGQFSPPVGLLGAFRPGMPFLAARQYSSKIYFQLGFYPWFSFFKICSKNF